MLDFTSALYLGLHHPSWSLRPWSQFTLGVPAALASLPEARAVAQAVAELQGCDSGVLGTSTLHLFWDLFGMLSRWPAAVYVDAGTYPIARWGAERAAARGVAVHEFAHRDVDALRTELRRHKRLRPLVLTDGFCPGCGKAAPLPEYLECVRDFDGWLVMDDSQALGIFGDAPAPDAPYGRGGGGMLRRSQIGGPEVLVISSLAKGFGVPVAVLSGSEATVKRFEANSETGVHCSPPSIAVIRAAENALRINHEKGDALRLHLAGLVARFRQKVTMAGYRLLGGLFPIQTFAATGATDTIRLYEKLSANGIRAALVRGENHHPLRISFSITARHSETAIDKAAAAFAAR